SASPGSPGAEELSNEADFERPSTDPPFADFLDRRCPVFGSHRNLSLVRRPLVATGTRPIVKHCTARKREVTGVTVTVHSIARPLALPGPWPTCYSAAISDSSA